MSFDRLRYFSLGAIELHTTNNSIFLESVQILCKNEERKYEPTTSAQYEQTEFTLAAIPTNTSHLQSESAR